LATDCFIVVVVVVSSLAIKEARNFRQSSNSKSSLLEENSDGAGCLVVVRMLPAGETKAVETVLWNTNTNTNSGSISTRTRSPKQKLARIRKRDMMLVFVLL
jgi:hypothetical protein